MLTQEDLARAMTVLRDSKPCPNPDHQHKHMAICIHCHRTECTKCLIVGCTCINDE